MYKLDIDNKIIEMNNEIKKIKENYEVTKNLVKAMKKDSEEKEQNVKSEIIKLKTKTDEENKKIKEHVKNETEKLKVEMDSLVKKVERCVVTHYSTNQAGDDLNP